MNGTASNVIQGYSYSVGNIMSNSPVVISGEAVSMTSAQPSLEEKHSREDMNVFFAIGVTINIVMIIAFVIWARKEFKKHGAPKE